MVSFAGGGLGERGKQLLRKHRLRNDATWWAIIRTMRGNEKLLNLVGTLAYELGAMLRVSSQLAADRETALRVLEATFSGDTKSNVPIAGMEMIAHDIGLCLRLLRDYGGLGTAKSDVLDVIDSHASGRADIEAGHDHASALETATFIAARNALFGTVPEYE